MENQKLKTFKKKLTRAYCIVFVYLEENRNKSLKIPVSRKISKLVTENLEIWTK